MKCSSEKVFFKRKSFAVERANELTEQYKNTNKPIRFEAYKCSECGGYHLTSIDIKKKRKSIKRFLNIETNYWEDKFGVE